MIKAGHKSTRFELINDIISKFKYTSYLEIGVNHDFCTFNKVVCAKKYGVDPFVHGVTHKMTSDEFFLSNKEKFDVIFIDGNHHHDFVYNDIVNSIKSINKNGVIILHDCYPPSVVFEQQSHCGTAWRALCEFKKQSYVDCITGDFDYGTTLMKIRDNKDQISFDCKFQDLQYKDISKFIKTFGYDQLINWL